MQRFPQVPGYVCSGLLDCMFDRFVNTVRNKGTIGICSTLIGFRVQSLGSYACAESHFC